MWVRNTTFDVFGNYNKRIVFYCRQKVLNPLRHIASNANEGRVLFKMLQFIEVMTLMIAYIDSALLHARHHTRMHTMPSKRSSLKTSTFDAKYVFIEKSL